LYELNEAACESLRAESKSESGWVWSGDGFESTK